MNGGSGPARTESFVFRLDEEFNCGNVGEIALSTIYGRDETVEVIARWEDADWSFNLVRLKYEPSLTLAVLPKRLDGPARAAIGEAIQLDIHEAPQREMIWLGPLSRRSPGW